MQGWVGIEPVGWLPLQNSGIQTASWSKVFLQGSRDVNEASWAWGCKVEAEARKSEDEAEARAFQFGQKSFDSIRFANLINLPLLHWYSNMVSLVKGLAASLYAVVHSVPYQYQLDNFQQVKNV